MIESFLKYIEFEKRYSRHTLHAYQSDLNQFQLHLQEVETVLQEADHHTIRSWMISLSESGISEQSINRKLASLRSFYKFLLTREFIKTDPTRRIRPLKSPKKIPEFIKEDEMVRILDHIEYDETPAGKRDQLILELLYGTGMRLSELLSLKVSDCNFSEQTILVLGKRNKERLIPVSRNLVRVIQDYLDNDHPGGANPEEFLIVSDKGKKAYPMLIYRTVRKYLDQFITLDRRSPHILRHTYATHLLNKGAELNAVKDLLGHASLAATQVYTHNTIQKLKDVFEQAHPKA